MTGDARDLIRRLEAYLLPGGEDAARAVSSIKAIERGEIRAAPRARAIPFTAEESIHTTRSEFRWDARMTGGLRGAFSVTDAYEGRQGRLVVKVGGLLPVKKMSGAEFDKGELQRYLAYVLFCPAILVNNPTLEYSALAHDRLRIRDREGPAGATVDLEVTDDGRPVAAYAIRPREKGVEVPWSAVASGFEEREGLRMPARLEASWHLADGAFTYITVEVVSAVFFR